jgi:hypothetical protein
MADDAALTYILYHARDNVWMKGHGIHLTVAIDTGVSR